MAAATIAAIAALASAGAGIYSAASSTGRPAQRAQDITGGGLLNSLSNQDYMKLLQTIGMQRSTAGSVDSEGNEVYYDPATNTWKTKLGDKPAQVSAAAQNASISRNTTDLRAAQAANEQAMRQAAQAQPGADAARREIENFRPDTAGDLTAAIVKNITDATNTTNRPVIQDLLANASRTGSAATPQIEAFGRTNADAIRRSIAEATIQGRQNVGQINASNLSPLVQRYSTLYGATRPQLQYSQLDSSDPNKVLATMAADRAKTAGTAPFAGMQGLGYAQYGVNQATTGAAGSQAPETDPTKILSATGQINDLFKNPNVQKKIDNWFGDSSTKPSGTDASGYNKTYGTYDPSGY